MRRIDRLLNPLHHHTSSWQLDTTALAVVGVWFLHSPHLLVVIHCSHRACSVGECFLLHSLLPVCPDQRTSPNASVDCSRVMFLFRPNSQFSQSASVYSALPTLSGNSQPTQQQQFSSSLTGGASKYRADSLYAMPPPPSASTLYGGGPFIPGGGLSGLPGSGSGGGAFKLHSKHVAKSRFARSAWDDGPSIDFGMFWCSGALVLWCSALHHRNGETNSSTCVCFAVFWF